MHFFSKKILSLIVIFTITLLLSVPLLKGNFSKAYGAFSNAKLVINNSQAAAAGVTYGFFVTASASTAVKQVDIQICTSASGTCNAPSGFSSGTPTLAADNISGTGRTTTAPTANAFRIVVGTPATQTPLAMYMNFTGVTNPSTTNTTYYARITSYSDTGSTQIDTNTVAFAVLTTTSIAVSATVDANFTFTIAGVNSGGTVNSATTTVTTAAATIPFGTFSIGSSSIGAHDVTITTNAGNGYVITASHAATITGNPPLYSGTNNIDAFSGSNASPATWSAPAGSSANTNTGYFGYTTEDTTLCYGTANRFDSNKWAGSTTTGEEVACAAAGVVSETTRVGWQAQVNAIQPAGSYLGTVILIATPTY